MESEVGGQVAGRAGADEEADAEGDADHGEGAGAFLRRGDVGDVRLRDREVAGGEAVDDAGEEDDGQIRRPGEDEEAGEGADLAGSEHRLAADAIGELAEDGAGDQLAERVGADEQADHGGAGVEMLGVEREQRQHHGEAEDVHHHDEENCQERRLHRARSLWHASSRTASSLAKQNRRSFSPVSPR